MTLRLLSSMAPIATRGGEQSSHGHGDGDGVVEKGEKKILGCFPPDPFRQVEKFNHAGRAAAHESDMGDLFSQQVLDRNSLLCTRK